MIGAAACSFFCIIVRILASLDEGSVNDCGVTPLVNNCAILLATSIVLPPPTTSTLAHPVLFAIARPSTAYSNKQPGEESISSSLIGGEKGTQGIPLDCAA